MTLKLTTGPVVEPVTLAEAKEHCRIDEDDLTADTLMEDIWIPAAREECEHELQRSLLRQTYTRILDGFPEERIELGMPRVVSVSSITYTDGNGDTQTLSPSQYVVDADREPGFVYPAYGTSWPSTLATYSTVSVVFLTGELLAASLPASVRAWILLRVNTFYERRGEFSESGKLMPLPNRFHAHLLDRYRRYI